MTQTVLGSIVSLWRYPVTVHDGRRINKRAMITVAHSLVIIGYYLQKTQRNYEDLGGDHFDRIHSDGLKRYLVRRLEKLGHRVTLVPTEAASQTPRTCRRWCTSTRKGNCLSGFLLRARGRMI
jgi:hypothetical protein